MTTSFHRYRLWLEYTLLALLILGPLLLPGYILTFDMSWTPHLPALSIGNNGLIFDLLLRALGFILPSLLIQKLLLLTIFVLAGVGAHRLAGEWGSRRTGEQGNGRAKEWAGAAGQWPACLAGLLYVVNPFSYTRLMAGQYLVLAGYALLPWFVRSLARLLESPKPGSRQAAAVVAWAVAIGAVNIHGVGFLAVLFAALVVAYGWGQWRPLLSRAGRWLAVVVGSWLVLSSYWLVPLVAGWSSNAHEIASFNAPQFAAYATVGGHVGVPLNVLSLQGFWGDSLGRYVLATATGWLFWLAWALLMALVLLGIWQASRRRNRLGLALAAAGLVAWVLAMGIAWPPVAGLTRWLVSWAPFYRGYREPQKWVAVLALAYAYLAAGGLALLRERWRGWLREAVAPAAGLIPLALAPMLLWGAGGQLRSAPYPASWAVLNQRLDQLPAGNIVLFPWHQYLYLDFAGRTVANPAPAYFDRPLITSDDPELLGVTPPQTVTASRVIENDILPRRFFATNTAAQFARLGVRYIVVLKQADWADYTWLSHQTNLRLLTDTNGWQLYQVEANQ